MEAGLDNANNPFTNSNGTLANLDVEADNINLQKSAEGLLLNLTDNFKSNGTDHSPDIFEKSNGTKKSTSELTLDDDFGPETDVDAVDDAFSPVETDKAFSDVFKKDHKEDALTKSFNDEVKAFAEGLANNNPLSDPFNPFMDQNKELHTEETKEVDFSEAFKSEPREDTPTPPADNVNDAVGLDTNAAESDSEEEEEDEWNYIKGDQTKLEITSSQPETVEEGSEQDDGMSNLNPNAAEFVPVSPTRSIPSPACRALILDEVISQSPKKPSKFDINLPDEIEFESEFKSRPSDFDYKNGHDESDHDNSANSDKIDNILNGKSLDEIPEFLPGNSTPSKLQGDEFHFGPNAAPFTPKVLDQSEALSTKANFGDDTEHTLNASFNDSELLGPSKEQSDPMSMSFYAEKGETNPFEEKEPSEEDLNKVHDLPDNLDDFLQEAVEVNKENISLCDTISDLPEHYPLGEPRGEPLDNDQAVIQTTDLDKISQDDEKELASPLDDQENFPEIENKVPSNDDVLRQAEVRLFDDFSKYNEKEVAEESNIPELEPIVEKEPVHEEVTSAQPELISALLEEEEVSSTSPTPVKTTEVADQQDSPPLPLLKDYLEDLLEPSHIEERFESQTFDNVSKSNVFDTKESVLSSDLLGLHSQNDLNECQFAPKEDVENFDFETKEVTPVESIASPPPPACDYFADESCKFERPDSSIPETHSPIDLLQEQKHEEVTSSVKDDVSSIEPLSPAKSPDSFCDENIKPEDDVHQAEVHYHKDSENSEAESRNEQIYIKTDTIAREFAESAMITPSEESRPIDEPSAPPAPLIEPENLVEKVIVDQLLLNQEEPVEASQIVAHVEEPKPVEEVIPKDEIKLLESVAEAPKLEAPQVPMSLPLVPASPLEVKTEKKSATPASSKKPAEKIEARKSTSSPRVPPRTSSKPTTTLSPRTATAPRVSSKTGAVKSPAPATKTTASTTASSRLQPKPKTTLAAPKAAERKPLANGDLKPKTSLAKKPATENLATKTTARPATASAALKPAPAKPATSRPITAPRTALLKSSATTTDKPKTTTAAAPRPRVGLASKTSTTAAATKTSSATLKSSTTTTTTTARTTVPAKPAIAPAKPRTLTSVPSKPRVPLTKTVTKSADLEKEKKESANKLTASRTTTVSKSSSATATSRTTTSTVRKSETKTMSDRTVAAKTTSSARTTTAAKKPGDVKHSPISRVKTTKVEKPKQNGVAPATVTEEIKETEITIVNNISSNAVVSEPESENLLKDNSPLDNKLIEISNTLID